MFSLFFWLSFCVWAATSIECFQLKSSHIRLPKLKSDGRTCLRSSADVIGSTQGDLSSLEILKATQKLRNMTGAGLSDCKNAVVEAKCDLEKAVSLLVSRGKAKAAKKEHVLGQDGRIGMLVKGRRGVLAELTCETDFVAKNEKFLNLASRIVRMIWASDLQFCDPYLIRSLILEEDQIQLGEALKLQSGIFGENLSLNRSIIYSEDNEGDSPKTQSLLHGYIHDGTPAQGVTCGKFGTILVIDAEGDGAGSTNLLPFAKSIALHIACERPSVVNKHDLTDSYIAAKRNVIEKEAKQAGVTKNLEKMVEGKLQKMLKHQILMDQDYALEDSRKSVSQVLSGWCNQAGLSKLSVRKFATLTVGESSEGD
eukprot:GHVN01050855.1.p1 GENE.GHVN01050855.1~~GHVN01050855.1.p1  ORF type:complete len:368 (-),score=43.73 GHVN01050855.1:282-1385(-)